jgi:hypothetical protein
MKRQKEIYVSAERLAQMLIGATDGLTDREYTNVLAEVLGDTESSEVALVAEHMPPELQSLFPKKYKH